ncbi:MAG: hypothetical protein RMK80_02815 [Pseudobdellovibrionaceae bacterium]|nr:hypothetical protein [Pseudobdellovibrionaceae bacterium]
MNLYRNVLLGLLFLILSSCHTIHLKNGKTYNKQYDTADFHHIFVLGFVEFSDPVVPQNMCPNGWDSVRTRTGPLQILVGAFTGPIYSPREVSVACKK